MSIVHEPRSSGFYLWRSDRVKVVEVDHREIGAGVVVAAVALIPLVFVWALVFFYMALVGS